jgi:uridylate kinase
MTDVCVVKYGGSFLIPKDEYDPEAILFLIDLVKEFPAKNFIFVIGGGGLSRKLAAAGANAIHSVIPASNHDSAMDELAIAATKMNAKVVLDMVTEILGEDVVDQHICIDPDGPLAVSKRVTLAAGGRPGHTTDYDMMLIAKNCAADKVFKISNFDKVLNVSPQDYDADKTYDELSSLSWSGFAKLVGDEYVSNGHYPLDPRAVRVGVDLAKKDTDFTLYIGKKEQLPAMLAQKEFVGTVIQK